MCRNIQRRNRMHLAGLIVDELYLIHSPDPLCPSANSLRGIFDKTIDRSSRSASDSSDLHEFRLWHPLPERCILSPYDPVETQGLRIQSYLLSMSSGRVRRNSHAGFGPCGMLDSK